MILLYGAIGYALRVWRPCGIALTAALAFGLPLAAAADEDLARELLDSTDDMYRGESSVSTMTMTVQTERWTRSMSMKVWTQGEERSLIQILSPPKEAGMATLKVEDNIWNYLPKVDRTMKVPASMMSGAWMGSHFTNDDLVKESRMADDYTFAITDEPSTNPDGLYVVECTPRPDAPVVWGKVVVRVRGSDRIPTEITYWDEKANLARTMLFEDIQEFGGRTLPTRMKLVPADKPDEYTELIYDDIAFDADVPASTFTLQALKP